jgi:hypothetical protein
MSDTGAVDSWKFSGERERQINEFLMDIREAG